MLAMLQNVNYFSFLMIGLTSDRLQKAKKGNGTAINNLIFLVLELR